MSTTSCVEMALLSFLLLVCCVCMHVCVSDVLITCISEGYPFYFLLLMSLGTMIVSPRNCGIILSYSKAASSAAHSQETSVLIIKCVAAVPNESSKQFSETIHKTRNQGRGSFCRASPSKLYVLHSSSPLLQFVAHTAGQVFSLTEALMRTVKSSHHF